jgi:hypothetical protein
MTETTRRSLLRASAVGLALAPVLVAPEAFATLTTRKDLYARRRFAALRRRTFRLEGADRHWRVRLTEVGNLPSSRAGDQRCFRLTFSCGSSGPGQGSYVLTRPGFLPTTLFLVPSDPERRRYEAVINRRH